MGYGKLEIILAKERKLEKILAGLDKLVVAYSGGTDSSYLLYKALQVLGETNVRAVFVASELMASQEEAEAEFLAQQLKAEYNVLRIAMLTDSQFSKNTTKRCYTCKNTIFNLLQKYARENRYPTVVDGTNADDQNLYRPGMQALIELGIRSPLFEAEMGKEEIRQLSYRAGLVSWNKPARGCLATRIPYGEAITTAKLKMISEAEMYLRKIGIEGNLRVRCHGTLARIEVDCSTQHMILSHRESIVEQFTEAGFTDVTLDLRGFYTGSMDRHIQKTE